MFQMTFIEILSHNKGYSELIRGALVKTRLSYKAEPSSNQRMGAKSTQQEKVDVILILFYETQHMEI